MSSNCSIVGHRVIKIFCFTGFTFKENYSSPISVFEVPGSLEARAAPPA
jgi:hypothetical protein